jgi:ribosomal peptide maturation radical SAM protein 1
MDEARLATTEQQRSRGSRVILVVPPFQDLVHPSLGVSQLKANLDQQGYRTEILYLNLPFAERIGIERYEFISRTTTLALAGEMVFSHLVFERSDEDLDRYVREVLMGTTRRRESLNARVSDPFGMMRELIHEAREFCCNEAVEAILARDPWLLGLSSSFQQNCSSLAVIQEVKRRRPDVLTIMGGANCEAEMGEELLAQFADLDFVGQGECDHSLVALVRALAAGETGAGIPGILARGASRLLPGAPLQGADLDALPYPDFGDYFEQLAGSSLAARIRPGLVMETSRGCWWGAKNHCTFCGLNGQGMAFRSKSPERAMQEMRALVEQYGIPRIFAVDNILDMRYFTTILPRLAEDPIASLAYETKANLTRQQVGLLSRSQIRWIQPGIESLSDRTLRLMRKGVLELQNAQLLKWCIEDGIKVNWNYLVGFPGEDIDELDRIAKDVETIHHLEPPTGWGTLHLDRFSPYFVEPEKWGLDPIYPAAPYGHVYKLPAESVARIAYVFECDEFEAARDGSKYGRVAALVSSWRRAHATAHLFEIPRRRSLILLDTRPCARRLVTRLTGLARQLYEHCRLLHSETEILGRFEAEEAAEVILSTLRSLVERRLLLAVDGRYLSVGVRLGPMYRNYPRVFPGGEFLPATSEGGPPRGRLARVLARLARGEGVASVRAKLARVRWAAKARLILRLARTLDSA